MVGKCKIPQGVVGDIGQGRSTAASIFSCCSSQHLYGDYVIHTSASTDSGHTSELTIIDLAISGFW